MKRFYTGIVLLGLVISAVLVGCSQEPGPAPAPDTNAVPAAPAAPSTNQ